MPRSNLPAGPEKVWDRGVALTSRLQTFETEMLAEEENFAGLTRLNRALIGRAETKDSTYRAVLDMDSTEIPVYGEREQSAYNGHFESTCYHPLLLFNREGDCLAGKLRPGNVHSAEGWEELLLPEIERQQATGKEVTFRADAAFAKPEIYEALEERGVKYTIRIPANDNLERDIAELLPRPVGRPGKKPLVEYKGFVPSRELEDGPTGSCEGRTSSGGVVPARRFHRDESDAAEPGGAAVLQQARHRRTVDQRRQAGGEDDAAQLSPVPVQRGEAGAECDCIQPGESLAKAGVATKDRELVPDEFAATAGEDGRSTGETCALLLAFAGRRTSESEAVRQHAENDRGVAAAGRLANQDGKQTSARKPSSGEVSAARQTGAGKTSTAAPQNGQNEPHDHPKGARANCG